MKKLVLSLLLVFFTTLGFSQDFKNQLSLVISPLEFNESTDFGLLYRYSFNEDWRGRIGLDFRMNTVHAIRADTQQFAEGNVSFTNSIGIQRNLKHGLDWPVYPYVALDLYGNSVFSKKAVEDYYYYFFNFGARPIIGLSTALDRFTFSLECRGDLNFDFQSYSGTGAHYDRNIRFSTVDRFALSLGYRF